MFGDPHMRTLDGYSYTFNGLGEYILTDIDNGFFVLQARTGQPIASDDSLVNGTVFVACAAQQAGSTMVQMTMNAEGTDFEVLLNGTEIVNKTLLASGKYQCITFSLMERSEFRPFKVLT